MFKHHKTFHSIQKHTNLSVKISKAATNLDRPIFSGEQFGAKSTPLAPCCLSTRNLSLSLSQEQLTTVKRPHPGPSQCRASTCHSDTSPYNPKNRTPLCSLSRPPKTHENRFLERERERGERRWRRRDPVRRRCRALRWRRSRRRSSSSRITTGLRGRASESAEKGEPPKQKRRRVVSVFCGYRIRNWDSDSFAC